MVRHRFAVLAAGLAATVLFALGRASDASPYGRQALVSLGVSLTVPAGWHGRAFVAYGESVIQAANFPLGPAPDPTGSRATRQMRRGKQVFLLLQEVGNQPG